MGPLRVQSVTSGSNSQSDVKINGMEKECCSATADDVRPVSQLWRNADLPVV